MSIRISSDTLAWHAAIQTELVTRLGGDKNAKDVCRVARTPGFLHHKDPTSRFICRIVHRSSARYTQAEMAEALGVKLTPQPAVRKESLHTTGSPHPLPRGWLDWDAMRRADQAELLYRLSGHPAVRGQTYSFREMGGGKLSIHVNGQPSAAWIDRLRRIGSLSDGGPSVYEWLTWFGHSSGIATRIIKEMFPEFVAPGDENGGRK